MDVTQYGVKADGTTDDLLAFQKLINDAPDGDIFDLPPARVIRLGTVSGDALDLSKKRGQRIRGNGGHGTNDSPPAGSTLSTGVGNQLLWKCDAGSLDQQGPTFESINFWDPHGGGTPGYVNTTNHWGMYRPNITGNWGHGLTVDFNPAIGGTDNSYAWLFEPTWNYNTPGAIPLEVKNSLSLKIWGGNVNATDPVAGFKLLNAQETVVFGTKFNHGGCAIYTEGGNSKFYGLSVEKWDPQFAIQVVRNMAIGAANWSGQANLFDSITFTAHPWGEGRFITFDKNSNGNTLRDPVLVGGYTDPAQKLYYGVQDLGIRNRIEPPLPFPQITGSKSSLAPIKQILAAGAIMGHWEDKTVATPLPQITGKKSSMAAATIQMLQAGVAAGIWEDKTT